MAKVNYRNMGNYKIDVNNKIIVAELNNLTDSEMHLISMYISAGYVIKEKKHGLTYDDMLKQLRGNDREELKAKIAAKENYMQVKKWFNTKIKK